MSTKLKQFLKNDDSSPIDSFASYVNNNYSGNTNFDTYINKDTSFLYNSITPSSNVSLYNDKNIKLEVRNKEQIESNHYYFHCVFPVYAVYREYQIIAVGSNNEKVILADFSAGGTSEITIDKCFYTDFNLDHIEINDLSGSTLKLKTDLVYLLNLRNLLDEDSADSLNIKPYKASQSDIDRENLSFMINTELIKISNTMEINIPSEANLDIDFLGFIGLSSTTWRANYTYEG